MDPIQVLLAALVLVGIWAVVELAVTVRRARETVGSLDKTVEEVNDVITEARPVIAKIDGALDDLAPALSQVEPLLKQAGVAVEALSADLIEVNGVLRDVSEVTGTVSSASGAVSGIADAASEKVQKLFGKKTRRPDSRERALAGIEETPEPSAVAPVDDTDASEDSAGSGYFTYGAESEGEAEDER